MRKDTARSAAGDAQEDVLRRGALDQVSDGVILMDAAGRILTLNARMANILQLGRSEHLGHIRDTVGRLQFRDGKGVEDVLAEARDSGRWQGRATCLLRDTHAGVLDVTVRVVTARGADPAGMLLVARDVTQETYLRNALMQSQQIELVENLSIGLAHEFRNLLTVITAYASLLKHRMRGTPHGDEINRIIETADEANELTQRLTAVARRTTPQVTEVDVNEVLKDVVDMLERTLPARIRVIATKDVSLPAIRSDRTVLTRALLNLCLNARDAMPDGGCLTIEVETVQLEDVDLDRYPDRLPGRYLVISVTDTGCGMAPEVRERIFEPFFTTKDHGTGLGLSVVQHTMKTLGAWVTVYSELGQGSCFRVYIPTAAQGPPVGRAAGEGAGQDDRLRGSERILVVDDDALVINITRRFLEEAGYTVWTALGGEEAVNLYRKHSSEVDLVVLDVVMPHINGAEVYQEMARINPAVAVLAVSGFTRRVAGSLLSVPTANFISKPFTSAELCGEVRRILDAGERAGG